MYAVDVASRGLTDVAAGMLRLPFEPYGLCLYASRADGSLYALVTGLCRGLLQQWELLDDGHGRAEERRVRDLSLQTQAEGCVVDGAREVLYVAEEEVGIWRYEAEPDGGADGELLDPVIPEGGEHLVPDVGGLALYHGPEGGRSLIASNQGASTFVVYGVNPFGYAGIFAIGAGEVDAVTHTDGIEATSVSLGEPFAARLFVAQDDSNDDGNQNFKLVPWRRIADALDLAE